MTSRGLVGAIMLGVLAAAVGGPMAPAYARPTYFDVFTSHYGISPGDNLYACGVCHYLWTGTGARNPYGSAVEQQLYLGKPILDSILDIEGIDSDGDGFTNGDEITLYQTLPGYSCANFFDAINPPAGFQAIITPFVPSCLPPIGIRVSPPSVSMITNAGHTATATVQVFNNGADFPLTINSYALLAGAPASLSLNGPTAPFDIPVGGSVLINVIFAPTATEFDSTSLSISSNDPDQGTLDVPVSGLGLTVSLASADQRAACLGDVQNTYRKYLKTALHEWGDCYLTEVSGRACDPGARDLALGKAETKLRSVLGGPNDRRCAPAGLTPSLLGLPTTCGGSCGSVAVTTLSGFADCLVCRQQEAVGAMLSDTIGTAPPDLPANLVAGAALTCQTKLLDATQKGIVELQHRFGGCELDNITAAVPADCATTLAADVAKVDGRIDKQVARCTDTTNIAGCLFGIGADPACLKTRAVSSGTALVDAVFGTP